MSTQHNKADQPRRSPALAFASDLYFVVGGDEEKVAGILSSSMFTTQEDAESMARFCLAQDDGTYHVFTFSLICCRSFLEMAEGARLVNIFSPSLPLGQKE